MKLGLRLALLPVVLWIASPDPPAFAECVVPDTPCRDYAHHAVVFQGLVERIIPIEPPAAHAADLRLPVQIVPIRRIHFRVERAWKGLQDASADILESGITDVGYNGFAVGERYLVYADRDPGTAQLSAFGCGRTKRLADAKRDLEFLQSLSGPATGGRIFGFVALKPERGATEPAGLPDVLLVLDGAGGRRQARSDPNGRFEFIGLEPGPYAVSVTLPPGYSPEFAQPSIFGADGRPVSATVVRIEIESDRDCAMAVFTARR